MGLFNKSNQQRRQIRTMHKERPSENGDLQYKAKSKLIGAAVLAALGAVILPFVFTSDEPINQTNTQKLAPLVAPGSQSGMSTSGAISISAAPGVSVQGTEPIAKEGETSVSGTIDATDLATSTKIPQSIASSVSDGGVETSGQSIATNVQTQGIKPLEHTKSLELNKELAQDTSKEVANPPQVTISKKENEEKHTVNVAKDDSKRPASIHKFEINVDTKSKADDIKRTDDGSVARAILEGKKVVPKPATTTSSANTSFPKPQSAATAKQRLTVQVGAFTSMDDARTQRDRLSSSGVSNVFIQNAVVNGRQTYRLRVGPFTNQESAQAALTRLRGLGHNGFITGN